MKMLLVAMLTGLLTPALAAEWRHTARGPMSDTYIDVSNLKTNKRVILVWARVDYDVDMVRGGNRFRSTKERWMIDCGARQIGLMAETDLRNDGTVAGSWSYRTVELHDASPD